MKTKTAWVVPKITGYKILTDYWEQFTKVELEAETQDAAIKAAKKLYKELLPAAKKDYKKLTELVMVLNHKCWDHSELDQNLIGIWYSDEYLKLHDWALDHLKGDEFSYYYQTVD